MLILVIFITGKQNVGYHRKLPASLPMAPSSKFQWAIQKINGPYHKHMHFLVLKVVQPIVIVFFLPAFIHTLQNILFSFK